MKTHKLTKFEVTVDDSTHTDGSRNDFSFILTRGHANHAFLTYNGNAFNVVVTPFRFGRARVVGGPIEAGPFADLYLTNLPDPRERRPDFQTIEVNDGDIVAVEGLRFVVESRGELVNGAIMMRPTLETAPLSAFG